MEIKDILTQVTSVWKNSCRRPVLLVPTDVRHISRAEDVPNDGPTSPDFPQQRADIVIEHSQPLSFRVRRLAVIKPSTVGLSRRTQHEGPVILHLEMVDVEDDTLFQLLLDGNPQSVRDGFPFHGPFFRCVLCDSV